MGKEGGFVLVDEGLFCEKAQAAVGTHFVVAGRVYKGTLKRDAIRLCENVNLLDLSRRV